MTATRDRRRDPEVRLDVEEWGQRSAFGASRGWPWWGAVLLALGLSIVGAFIDMKMSSHLGKVFEGAYFVGCVGAVCLVRRRNLFGPMVQAPLILAVTVPVVVLLTAGLPSGSSTVSKLLALGVPLVTGFPTMAITTGATVLIGGIRFLVQRRPAGVDSDDDRGDRPGSRRRPSDRDLDPRDRDDRAAGPRRPRPAGVGRSAQDSAGSRNEPNRERDRDRGSAPRDRVRTAQPPARGRSGGAAERGGPTADRGGRPASGRAAGQDRDRERGQGRDRGQPDRDRGQARGGRPARDDARRQPPRRRGDDD